MTAAPEGHGGLVNRSRRTTHRAPDADLAAHAALAASPRGRTRARGTALRVFYIRVLLLTRRDRPGKSTRPQNLLIEVSVTKENTRKRRNNTRTRES